ncbi:MAG: NADH-quinone oxidoreductase subunit L, partial [Burkholderiales bacterium]|nr:NADH-quinone oxidoreductase subunit L [Burkholderiales bacterium]
MASSISQNLLLTVPLAPLAGALLAGLAGKKIGVRGAHTVTILGVLVAFIGSALVLWQVAGGARYAGTVYQWAVQGRLVMEVGFLVDGLTAMMMVVVTFVSLMVHVYTIGYMEGDP